MSNLDESSSLVGVGTTAHIIVTVDHTQYTGSMDIGAVSMIVSGGSSAHFSATNIPLGSVTPPEHPSQPGWEATFNVQANTEYIIYAVSPDGAVGAARQASFSPSNSTRVLEIAIQPAP
jgi:hypothetical protein